MAAREPFYKSRFCFIISCELRSSKTRRAVAKYPCGFPFSALFRQQKCKKVKFFVKFS